MAESLLKIKKRIKSVESIRKITKVMKLIASSKYTSFKNVYDGNLPYLTELKKTMDICLYYQNTDNKMPTCMMKNSGDKKLYIFISSTLGLCGAYQNNLEKIGRKEFNKNSDVVFIGEKGYQHLKNYPDKSYTDFMYLLDDLTYQNVNSFRHYLDSLYKKNKYNEVIVIYSKFINSFSINPIKEHLFPLIKNEDDFQINEPIFEGDPKDIIDLIVPHYLDSYLYHILIESALSEQTSRKNSMENATESAEDLIHDLGIKYNRRRQGKITQEITEIISGN